MKTHREDAPLPAYSRAISGYFYLLVAEMLATLVVSVILYGEPFHFWEYAFSDLGSTATWDGQVNAPARLVFTLGGLGASWIMLQVWAAYSGKMRFRSQKIKRSLGALGTTGFLLASVPNSQHHITHTVGAVLSFAALYLFTMLFYFELKAKLPGWLFVLEVALLQVVLFTYAVAFFADWPTKQGFQKVCLMGVFYTLLRTVSVGEDRFRLRQVLGMFERVRREQD